MENTIILDKQIFAVSADTNSADLESLDQFSDSLSVNSVLAGDEAAYEEIFDKYKRFVAKIGARYFYKSDQIEEMIQITFTKAYFELGNFRGQSNREFAGWLGKIASNSCLDIIKKQKRKPEDLFCEFTEEDAAKILTFAKAEKQNENNFADRDLAEKLLTYLPPFDRSLLQMLYAEEMSIGEIAEITGKSRANIKIRVYRAKTLLRKVLKKYL